MFRLPPIRKQSRLIVNLFVILFVAILISTMFQHVAAGTINTIPQYGFLNGVTAYAEVRSFPGTASNAVCSIKSYTSPATTINVIGWTWRQCDLLKNGAVLPNGSQNFQGYAPSGSSQQATAQFNNIPPGAYDQIKSHGKHDFNHNGSSPSPWQPYNVNFYP